MPDKSVFAVFLGVGILLSVFISNIPGAEPPAFDPFGRSDTQRDDARAGKIELSDGSMHRGMIYLTRDKRLQVYDRDVQRQREVPLTAVKKIECEVQREWLEKEWRFRENANNEKTYTGRSYPAREYLHTLTLNDGRSITGALSAIIYLQPNTENGEPSPNTTEPERFFLKKRDKGKPGEGLDSLLYIKQIEFQENQ